MTTLDMVDIVCNIVRKYKKYAGFVEYETSGETKI